MRRHAGLPVPLVLIALTGCVDRASRDVVEDAADVAAAGDARDDDDADAPRPTSDGGADTCAALEEDTTAPTWCSLGADVPGASVPSGFCLRRFAAVGSPRALQIACNGDVLVSAPTLVAGGGSGHGPGG